MGLMLWTIRLRNSLAICLKNSLEIKLLQINARDRKRLLVKIMEKHKQTIYLECRFYTTVIVVESCFTGFT